MALLAINYMKHRAKYYSNLLIVLHHFCTRAEDVTEIIVAALTRFTPACVQNAYAQECLQDHKQSSLPDIYRVKCL